MENFDFISRVIFLNPIRSIRNEKTNYEIQQGDAKKNSLDLFPWKYGSNIWIYTPYRFFPFKRFFPLLKKIENGIFYQITKFLNRRRPFLLLLNDPIKVPDYIVKKLMEKAEVSIFDFSDDFVEYFADPKDPRRFRCLENIERYAGAADLVLTVNEHVKSKYHYVNPHIEVVRNATNYDNFDREAYSPVDFLEPIKKLGRPIAGCSGGIRKNRVDFNLLDFIIEKKPEWQLVFIGDTDSAFKKRFQYYRNVHVFPSVNYKQLPDCINYFDITFIPFRCNEHTKGNDLLKIYDYLAMGKPVVSTRIGEIESLSDIIFIANSYLEFIEKMVLALKESAPGEIDRRKFIGSLNSWPIRIKDLERLLVDRLANKLDNCKGY